MIKTIKVQLAETEKCVLTQLHRRSHTTLSLINSPSVSQPSSSLERTLHEAITSTKCVLARLAELIK